MILLTFGNSQSYSFFILLERFLYFYGQTYIVLCLNFSIFASIYEENHFYHYTCHKSYPDRLP